MQMMPAAKDSKLATSTEKNTTTGGEESVTPAPQPSGLGELATSVVATAGGGRGTVQGFQVSSLVGADKTEEPWDRAARKASPTPSSDPRGMPWSYGWKLR